MWSRRSADGLDSATRPVAFLNDEEISAGKCLGGRVPTKRGGVTMPGNKGVDGKRGVGGDQGVAEENMERKGCKLRWSLRLLCGAVHECKTYHHGMSHVRFASKQESIL